MLDRKQITLLTLVVCFSMQAFGQDRFADLNERLFRAADAHLRTLQEITEKPSEQIQKPEPQIREDAIRRLSMLYWNGREDNLRQAIQRVEGSSPLVTSILRNEGLPAEFVAVVLIESAGRVNAVSRAGATGAWQFMPATARRYGLDVNGVKDERLNLEKATRAAARHLRDLHERFGSWELALAAYNAGPTAVQRALERAKSRDFAEVKQFLPRETRHYVPAVLQAVNIFGDLATLQRASSQ